MKKGITLLTLIVMVTIMLILTTTITITGVNAMNNAKKMKFASELLFMQETIDDYKSSHEGNLPIKGSAVTSENLPTGEYYEIDMSLLGLIDTTYGKKLNDETEDIYVVSKTSNAVYYLKGLKIGNTVYYNLTEELKNVINYTDTKIVSKDGILFTPSNTNYTNQEINVKVQIPTEYSEVSVLSQDIQITEFTTEGSYNVYNVSKASNYDVVVTYTKDEQALKQVYTVSNYDAEAPSIAITNKDTLNNKEDIKTSITISTNDNLSGVSKVLYEVDNVEKSYFETESKGKIVENNNVVVDKFTKYVTFYVVDKAGNSKILLETLNPTATEDDYVDYGLILHYDAINNTGNGHSSTTTVWKDLSGNGNNGTLTNFDNTTTSGWKEDCLTLDGVNDFVTSYAEVNKELTIEFMSQNIGMSSNAVLYGINIWNATLTTIPPSMVLWYTDGVFYNRLLVPATSELAYKEKSSNIAYYSIGQRINNTIIVGNNEIKVYINGKLHYTYDDDEIISRFKISKLNISIGRWYGMDRYYSNININAMRIYNRALTEDEITQNYNIDKIRFGI